jgi:hypothetical protein
MLHSSFVFCSFRKSKPLIVFFSLEDNSSSIHHTESLQSSSDTSIIDGYANQSTSQIPNTDKLTVTNE